MLSYLLCKANLALHAFAIYIELKCEVGLLPCNVLQGGNMYAQRIKAYNSCRTGAMYTTTESLMETGVINKWRRVLQPPPIKGPLHVTLLFLL